MHPARRLLLPILLLVLASLACNSTEMVASGGTEPTRAGEMASILNTEPPAATSPVDGVSAPFATEIPLYTPTSLPKAIVEATAVEHAQRPWHRLPGADDHSLR